MFQKRLHFLVQPEHFDYLEALKLDLEIEAYEKMGYTLTPEEKELLERLYDWLEESEWI